MDTVPQHILGGGAGSDSLTLPVVNPISPSQGQAPGPPPQVVGGAGGSTGGQGSFPNFKLPKLPKLDWDWGFSIPGPDNDPSFVKAGNHCESEFPTRMEMIRMCSVDSDWKPTAEDKRVMTEAAEKTFQELRKVVLFFLLRGFGGECMLVQVVVAAKLDNGS